MKEHLPSQDYSILVGHELTDGSKKTTEQLHTEYIRRTDELIHQMTHGVEITNFENGEREHKIPDVVVFLDKSARPLAWLTRELWSRLAVDEEDKVPSMPDMKFLNIDRKQWANRIDRHGNGHLDVSQLDESIIRSLRSIFISPTHKQDGLTDEIDNSPADLDGKTILIVDEVHSTGSTLQMAEGMIAAAFPSANIAGMHWMAGVTDKGFARGNADVPVWYKKQDPRGRGVNDRMKDPSGVPSENLTQRLGAWFLSTRFKGGDPASLQLREEMHRLANDEHVPIRISPFRYDVSTDEGFSDYKAHTERVNNGRSFEDVQASLTQIASKR